MTLGKITPHFMIGEAIIHSKDADIYNAFNKDVIIKGIPGGKLEESAKKSGYTFIPLEESTEPEPEPVHVPTNEEIQQIVEQHMWTKDPSEYTREEVVHSLECLAALQKTQLQDQATKGDYFLETYRSNREAVKEQVSDTLAAFNISFEEVESIFKRVIFE